MSAQPTNISPALRAGIASDAINDAFQPLMALEAIEQLLTPQADNSPETLKEVNRESLAWLLTLVNMELRRNLENAAAKAREVLDHTHAASQGATQ